MLRVATDELDALCSASGEDVSDAESGDFGKYVVDHSPCVPDALKAGHCQGKGHAAEESRVELQLPKSRED